MYGPSGGVNLYCRLVRMLFSEWSLTPLSSLISSGITFPRRPRSSGQRPTNRSSRTSCYGYTGAVMQPTSPASSNGSICGCSSGKTIKPADESRCGLRKPSPPCGSSGRSYRGTEGLTAHLSRLLRVSFVPAAPGCPLFIKYDKFTA